MGRKSQERMTGLTYEQRVRRAGGPRTKEEIDKGTRLLSGDIKRMMRNKFKGKIDALSLWSRMQMRLFYDSSVTTKTGEQKK